MRFYTTLIIIILTSSLLTVPAGSHADVAAPIAALPTSIDQGVLQVAESNQLILRFDTGTAEISVHDKAGNMTWYSNPQDREQEGIAQGLNKTNLSSQLYMKYMDHLSKVN